MLGYVEGYVEGYLSQKSHPQQHKAAKLIRTLRDRLAVNVMIWVHITLPGERNRGTATASFPQI